jgi:hypothetical protein
MTAVYTHTRPETVRDQLAAALAGRPALDVARAWAAAASSRPPKKVAGVRHTD